MKQENFKRLDKVMNLSKSKHVLLVDGNNLLHRICHIPAFSSMTSSDGLVTGGLYGLLKSLRKSLSMHMYSNCVVVWDYGKSKRRMEFYPEYKANRTVDTRDAAKIEASEAYFSFFNSQRSLISDVLPLMGVREVSIRGKEGDDVIYKSRSLIREFGEESYRFVVLSEDKDFYQMVDSDTDLYRPIADEYTSASGFIDLVGIDASRFLLYKSIVGDGSDNIPGVSGVGDKTAIIAASLVESLSDRNPSWDWEELEFKCRKHKSVRVNRIADNIDLVRRNYDLVALYKEEFDSLEQAEILESSCKSLSRDSMTILKLFKSYEYSTITRDFANWMIPFKSL